MSRNASGVYSLPPSDVAPAVSGQTIDPATFNAQNTDIGNEITNSLDRLGRSAMEANLPMGGYKATNVAAGAAAGDGAAMSNVFLYVPVGVIFPFAFKTIPTGWLPCDGSAVSRSTYAALFAALNVDGLAWGVGDGSTTFNVPDFRGMMLRGWDAYGAGAAGRDSGRAWGAFQADRVGSLGSGFSDSGHTHGATDSGHVHPMPVAGNNAYAGGGGTAINNGAGLNTGLGYALITIGAGHANITYTGGPDTAPKNNTVVYGIRT